MLRCELNNACILGDADQRYQIFPSCARVHERVLRRSRIQPPQSFPPILLVLYDHIRPCCCDCPLFDRIHFPSDKTVGEFCQERHCTATERRGRRDPASDAIQTRMGGFRRSRYETHGDSTYRARLPQCSRRLACRGRGQSKPNMQGCTRSRIPPKRPPLPRSKTAQVL